MRTQIGQWLLPSAALVASLTLATVLAADKKPESPAVGTWKWTFSMPDGSQVSPRLKIKEEEGKLSGTSSFRTGSEVGVTNLTLSANDLSFEVARERDGQPIVSRYSGVINSNKIAGKVTSNWSGEEQSYPWEAVRMAGIDGTWEWGMGGGS